MTANSQRLKTYKTKKERMEAFERLIINIENFKTVRGELIHVPGLYELVNIYNQAENNSPNTNRRN